ncbi:hypothetical protein YC2023_016528 [Brassica napus]
MTLLSELLQITAVKIREITSRSPPLLAQQASSFHLAWSLTNDVATLISRESMHEMSGLATLLDCAGMGSETSGLAMLLVRECGAETFVPWTLLERAGVQRRLDLRCYLCGSVVQRRLYHGRYLKGRGYRDILKTSIVGVLFTQVSGLRV